MGLKSLKQQPLQFLGLLSCAQQNNPSSRPCIPAKLVTGHASFQQLLNSLRVYQNWSHHGILCKVILLLHGNLYETAPVDVAPSMLGLLLDELLGLVESHLHEKYFVTVAIRCVFKIVMLLEGLGDPCEALSEDWDAHMKGGASKSTQSGRILLIVLEICEKYWTDSSLIYQVVPLVSFLKGPLLHLGLLKGTNFRRLVGAVLRQIVFALTPTDLKSEHFRMMKASFDELTIETEEEEVVALIELNPVKEICACIRRLLLAGNLELVADCWGLLCHLTDESEHHCAAFMASGGLDLFLDTIDSSPPLLDHSPTAEIPMMTLCNLLSHETWRPDCFNNTRILHFVLKTVGLTDLAAARTALNQFPEQINFTTEYFATMYLVNFLESDGSFSWEEIDWGEICPQVRSKQGLDRYLAALMTRRWGQFLEFDDGLEYASLDDFLRLCDNRTVVACRIFGLWSLVHLTSTRPEEYSPMLSLALRDIDQIRTELRGLQADSSATLDWFSGDASG